MCAAATVPALLATLLLTATAAAQPTPASPGESAYLRGVDRVAAGELDQAAELFRLSLDDSPDGPYAPSVLLMWGDTERQRGNHARAIELYGELLERFPTHRSARSADSRKQRLEERAAMDEATATYWSILEGYDVDDAAAAVEQMEQLLAAHPDHPIVVEVACWLGSQYRQRGEYEAAVEAYEAALSLSSDAPCNLRALEYIAVSAMDRGQLPRARNALDRMKELGDAGLAAHDHHRVGFRREARLEWIGRVLAIGALLALAAVFGSLRLGAPRLADIRVAAAWGGTVAFVGIGGAILTSGSLRPFLLTLGLGLGALVVLHGLRKRPLARWSRWAYPPAVAWLVIFLVFGCLRTMDWI
jgi:TolA-binding protein